MTSPSIYLRIRLGFLVSWLFSVSENLLNASEPLLAPFVMPSDWRVGAESVPDPFESLRIQRLGVVPMAARNLGLAGITHRRMGIGVGD